jgi:cell division protein FtsB
VILKTPCLKSRRHGWGLPAIRKLAVRDFKPDAREKQARDGTGETMRFSAFIFPLLACGAGGYFAYHLETGEHGLKARTDLERRKEVLAGELAGLKEVRMRLERDVSLLRPESLDPDMLDERARAILNLAHEDDLVMLKRRQAVPDAAAATGTLPKR